MKALLAQFGLNAGMSALNFGFYAVNGHWWSLAAGIFSGVVALVFLIGALRP